MSQSTDPIRAILEEGAKDPDPVLARKARRALKALDEWDAAQPTALEVEVMSRYRRERPEDSISNGQLLAVVRRIEEGAAQ